MRLNQKVRELWDMCQKKKRVFETDLRGVMQVCQKVEVVRIGNGGYSKWLYRIRSI